jgi:hypothetical protein
MIMNTAVNAEAEKDNDLLVLVNELIASLPNPHSFVMRIEVGDRHGSDSLYLIDVDGNPLNYSRRDRNKIWQHFYDWRKPTQNSPDDWNLAILRWSAVSGVTVEYGHADVEDVGNSRNRRILWAKQEFGDREIPFFIEERKKKSESSVAEKM